MSVQIVDNLLQWRPAPALEPLAISEYWAVAAAGSRTYARYKGGGGSRRTVAQPRRASANRGRPGKKKELRRGRRIKPGGRIGPGGLGCGGHAGTVHSTAANTTAGRCSPLCRGRPLPAASRAGLARRHRRFPVALLGRFIAWRPGRFAGGPASACLSPCGGRAKARKTSAGAGARALQAVYAGTAAAISWSGDANRKQDQGRRGS